MHFVNIAGKIDQGGSAGEEESLQRHSRETQGQSQGAYRKA
jgi:hypothetical protein